MPNEDVSIAERVSDEEILYRSVRQDRQEIIIREEGVLHISPQAFADRNRQPSLYRHILCDHPPYSNPPRMGAEQAVLFLVAGKIRQEASPLEHKAGKQEAIAYVIDVKPDTSNNQHPSHAVVFANPEFQTNGAFEKLKIRLAQLAEGWAILPAEPLHNR